jgi:hypothetical protein
MRRVVVLFVLVVIAVPGILLAQQVSGNARAGGMADAYGALARGVEAAFYNPANLGLGGNPRVSVALPTASVGYGSTPISFRELDRYGGRVVPPEVRAEWLATIPVGGAFRGSVGADVQGIGASYGRYAVSWGVVAQAALVLPRTAAEVFLFGNADVHESFTGGSGRYFAASFVAVSGGFPLLHRSGGSSLAAGGSLKYVRGHAYGSMWDLSGVVGDSAGLTDLRFPAVTIEGGRHHGFGVDIAVAWQHRRLSLGIAVTDLVSSFGWDQSGALLRDGRALVSEDSIAVEFDGLGLDEPGLPFQVVAEARDRLRSADFRPAARLSAAVAFSRAVLALDLVHRSGDRSGLRTGPPTQVGAGVEYHATTALRLRAGIGWAEGGSVWTVGSGVVLGPVAVDVGLGQRNAVTRKVSLLSVGMGMAW